jgi:hypothetical protein
MENIIKKFLIILTINQVYYTYLDHKLHKELTELNRNLSQEELLTLTLNEFNVKESNGKQTKVNKQWESNIHALDLNDTVDAKYDSYVKSTTDIQGIPIINKKNNIHNKKLFIQHNLFNEAIRLKIKSNPIITYILIITLIIFPFLIIKFLSNDFLNGFLDKLKITKNTIFKKYKDFYPMFSIIFIMNIYFLIIHLIFLFITMILPSYKLFFFHNNKLTMGVQWFCLMAITISWFQDDNNITFPGKIIIWSFCDGILIYIIYNFQNYFLGNLIYMEEYENPITLEEAMDLFKDCKTYMDCLIKAENEQKLRKNLGKKNIAITLDSKNKALIDVLIKLNIKID